MINFNYLAQSIEKSDEIILFPELTEVRKSQFQEHINYLGGVGGSLFFQDATKITKVVYFTRTYILNTIVKIFILFDKLNH